MNFLEPNCLWLLLCLPIVCFLFIYSWIVFSRFINSPKANIFKFNSNLPTLRTRIISGVMFVLSLALIIFGLAKPYYLKTVSKKEYPNVRIIFLLDVSLSMSFAEDVKPNRLVAAKEWVGDFYKSLDGIYDVALVPFAGDPNTFYCPPSRNYSAFLALLEEVNFESVMSPGTDLANVFSAIKSFGKNEFNLIVVLSDGGKEDGFLVNRALLQKEISNLVQKGFQIHSLGIGDRLVTPLIKRDQSGNPAGFMTDNNGKTLYSQLDEDVLKNISSQGNGVYRNFSQKEELSKILSEIIFKNRKAGKDQINYVSVFIYHWFFALAAIIIFTISILNVKR